MIGNCRVNNISMAYLLPTIDKWISSGEKNNYIIPLNLGKLVLASRDKYLAGCIENSTINIADGISVYLASRISGHPLQERITGIEVMRALMQLANEKRYRVFLLGSRPAILRQFIDKCTAEFPDIIISGYQDGYFNANEEEIIVKRITGSHSDILFVALGMPQKEYFIGKYYKRLGVGIILPVGGGFDVFVGAKKRAPVLFQKLYLEWLWRSMYDMSRARLIIRNLPAFLSILHTTRNRKND